MTWASFFKAPPELPDDNIVYIHVSSATTPPTTSINAISVTDADSSDPCGVDNGRNLFVAWRKAYPEGKRIEGAFLEYDGSASSAGVISGEGYLVVYFYYRDSPVGSDLLYLVELDADAVPVDVHSIFLSSASSLAEGRPAVVWAGDHWAVFWEEYRGSAGDRSRLHLTTKFPGGHPMDEDISAQWSPAIPSITGYQPGELDMVWTGDELGLVMTYDAGEAGRKITFGEFDLSGRVLGDIVPVSVIATAMFNPSLTFMRSATERYYLFAWLQLFSSGALSDLWTFDLETRTWRMRVARGSVPDGLCNFSYAQGGRGQGVGAPSPFEEGTIVTSGRSDSGFLWGGVKEDGSLSDRLDMLDLPSGEFRSRGFSGQSPPGMTGASMSQDPGTGRIYLFGGFDGVRYHNWLWSLDVERMKWRLEEEDCASGTCPYLGATSAIITSGPGGVKAVFVGTGVDPSVEKFLEPYFLYTHEGWKGGSAGESWAIPGDCDGDGVKERLWGSRCASYAEWWNPPGKQECDTVLGELSCSQEPSPPVSIYRHLVPGLKDFRVRNGVVYYTRGRKIFSADASDPARLHALGSVDLRGDVRDIELWGDRIVAASDARISIVDAGDPEAMIVERTVEVCAPVLDVDVVEGSAFFLTLGGIGSVNLLDDGGAPETFELLMPMSGGGWDLAVLPVDHCRGFHPGPAWGFFDPLWRLLPDGFIEAGKGHAYVGMWRYFIAVSLDPAGWSVEGSIRLDSKIEGMKVQGDFAYLDLKRGGAPIIDLFDPSSLEVVGIHSVSPWVRGIQEDDMRVYKKEGSRIEVSVPR